MKRILIIPVVLFIVLAGACNRNNGKDKEAGITIDNVKVVAKQYEKEAGLKLEKDGEDATIMEDAEKGSSELIEKEKPAQADEEVQKKDELTQSTNDLKKEKKLDGQTDKVVTAVIAPIQKKKPVNIDNYPVKRVSVGKEISYRERKTADVNLETSGIVYNRGIRVATSHIKPKRVLSPAVNKKISENYIRVGNERIGQALSPRKGIKVTAVVFNTKKYSARADFQVYAVPVGSRLRMSGYYMISGSRNIDLIKNQAQMTRYWNGKNVYGKYLPKGKYNIYIYYKVKDRRGRVMEKSGRYWGKSRKFYVQLY